MTDLRSRTSLDEIVIQERTTEGWFDAKAKTYSQESRREYLDLIRFYRGVAPEVQFRVIRRTVRVTEEVIVCLR